MGWVSSEGGMGWKVLAAATAGLCVVVLFFLMFLESRSWRDRFRKPKMEVQIFERRKAGAKAKRRIRERPGGSSSEPAGHGAAAETNRHCHCRLSVRLREPSQGCTLD